MHNAANSSNHSSEKIEKKNLSFNLFLFGSSPLFT